MSRDIAITVFSTLGAVFWSIQLIPQIYLNYKNHSTEGLQPSMMLLWSLAGLPLGVHNVLSNQPIALQIQAQILTALSLVTLAQVMYYSHKWSLTRCLSWLAFLTVLFATIEAGFIFGIIYGDVSEGSRSATIHVMAVLSAVGLALGVLRQYWDAYENGTVRGIAWGFVVFDALGDLTSLVAVILPSPIDKWATGIYASELALWLGFIFIGIYFTLRPGSQAPENTETEIVQEEQEGSESSSIRSMSAFATARHRSQTLLRRLRPGQADSNRIELAVTST